MFLAALDLTNKRQLIFKYRKLSSLHETALEVNLFVLILFKINLRQDF